MAWFKMDDQLYGHKKTRRAGVEAIGLWAVCGAWSAAHDEDGFVPDYVAETFTPKARAYAKRLVAAGFWVESSKEGDSGWQFHDWAEYQPTAEQRQARRDRWATYKRETRSQSKVSALDTARSPRGVHDLSADSPQAVQWPRPDPTRPDPNQLEPDGSSEVPRKRGTRLNPNFQPTDDTLNKIATECPNLDIDREHARFVDYWTDQPGAKGVRVSWEGTWRNWMRRAAETQRHGRQQQTDDLFARAAQRAAQRDRAELEGNR